MKNYLLLLFLGFTLLVEAQNLDKITFDYDAAGNQIKRELCLSCNKAGYKTTAPKEIAALQEEDMQKLFPEDMISYYPNPVKEELYLKWELANENTVSSLYVYNINGKTLQSFMNLERLNTQIIPFQAYPTGVYLIVLLYSNGEQKTIKIVK
ncbi:T9SS type A sorting domain-containing protein [Flavobacterium sp. XS2P14]|uniref:T9SS type A sorting domain-containing protein n=1 Tax=Flavobacterium sp. XS2P14 TaxID=3401735 RepID=UPI003AAF9382